MDSVSHDSLPEIVFKIKHTQDFPRFGMILERSLLRDRAEGSTDYLKYHLLQNDRKIIGEFITSLPKQVLSQVFTSEFSLSLIKFWSSINVQTKLICQLPKPVNWYLLE